MPSDGMPCCHARGFQTLAGFTLKVPGWCSVYVLCSLLCVLTLPRPGDTNKPRCGRELVADLEFVCGDRGFYRGKPGSGRGGGLRSRGKGIVELCCIRGCDLQHLESYCAKPKKVRREAPGAPDETSEAQFWLVFQRRYQAVSDANRDRESLSQTVRERMLYSRSSRKPELHNNKIQTQPHTSANTTSGPHVR